jgi:hypothetical protein
MSFILSIHEWQGLTKTRGTTHCHSVTLGWLTLTITNPTIERILERLS